MYTSALSACYFLVATALLTQLSHATSQFTYNGTTYDVPDYNDTTAINMIYPRNATYGPQELFPVIVALQSTQVAAHLQMKLKYELFPLSSVSAGGSPGASAELQNMYEATDATFGTYWLSGLRNKTLADGRYRMVLTASFYNCSIVPGQGISHPKEGLVDSNFREDRQSSRSAAVEFTISKDQDRSTHAANAEETTEPYNDKDTCARNAALAFRVVAYVPWAGNGAAAKVGALSACAILSDKEPMPRPCDYQVAQDETRTIRATIEAAECKEPNPVIKCPKPISAAAALVSMGGAMSALVGCFATWALVM